MHTPAPRKTVPLRAIAAVCFVALGVWLAFFTEFGQQLFTGDGQRELIASLDDAVSSAGWWGAILFILVYAGGSMVFSTIPLNAAGVFIFGAVTGSFYSFVGCMIGSVIGFFLGRFLFRGTVEKLFAKRIAWLDEKAKEHGFILILTLRVVGFPYAVLKYAAGASAVHFRDYFWGTAIGIIPSIVLESCFFGRLKEILSNYKGPADLWDAQLIVSAAAFLAFCVIPILALKRKRDGERKRAQENAVYEEPIDEEILVDRASGE